MDPTFQLPSSKSNYRLLAGLIVITGFVAGSLDALAAIYILSHGNARPIFKYIASGIYGKEAFAGGDGMVALGIAIHYFIAFSFTVFYFAISRYAAVFLPKNIFLKALIYGLFIYVCMNLIVSSISNVNVPHRTAIGVLKNSAILMICVALPIMYFNRVYNSKR